MGCPSCGCTELFVVEYGLGQCPCCVMTWVTDERGSTTSSSAPRHSLDHTTKDPIGTMGGRDRGLGCLAWEPRHVTTGTVTDSKGSDTSRG
jgi:hypothetical protein